MQLENLHHSLNLRDNIQFHMICYRWSMVTFIFCRRLPESDITATPSVTCMDWSCWWNYHAAHAVSSSTTLACLKYVSDKHKFAPLNTIQVKNWQKTISIEEKSDIISWLVKGEQIVDICRKVRHVHSSVCTIHDNADRIKENARSRSKALVQLDYHSPISTKHTKVWMSVSYTFIALEINKYIVYRFMYTA